MLTNPTSLQFKKHFLKRITRIKISDCINKRLNLHNEQVLKLINLVSLI